MRIVEQTECVLTLRGSAKWFWFETAILLYGGPISILILFSVPPILTGWWKILLLFLLLSGFCLGLQQAWSSDVVKSCSFDRVLKQVAIDFHGLKPMTENFPLGEMQVLEVRETMQAIYGSVYKGYQLWLVINSKNILLSDDGTNAALEEIVDRVREFSIPI